jgi:hypothetical protein
MSECDARILLCPACAASLGSDALGGVARAGLRSRASRSDRVALIALVAVHVKAG